MKTETTRRILGGLATLVLGGSLANASSITWYNNIFYTPDSPSAATNSPQGAPTLYATPFSTTVSIPRFDETIPGDPSHINQLTSVQIVIDWAVNATIGVFDFDTVNHSFTNATAAIPISIVGPDGTTVFATGTGGPLSGTTSNPMGVTNFPGATGTGSANNTVIGAGLTQYEGFGSSNLNFAFAALSGTYGGTETGGSGHLFFGGTANAGASVRVTYNYETTAVPEPVGFLTLGPALIGLGFLLRRRTKA
jgi:hypothetical protein